MAKLIRMSKGYNAIVDDEDYDYLNQFSWSYSGGYAIRAYKDSTNGKLKSFRMHRVIMNAPKGMEVDHINGIRHDNRRENLRICTRAQNAANQKKTRGSSKYKGVYWEKHMKSWKCQVCFNGKVKNLGRFKIEEDAARRYNVFMIENFGEFAKLNILY